jgi:hypothetical protein
VNALVAWIILIRSCASCDWQQIYPPQGMAPRTEAECLHVIEWLDAGQGNAKCVKGSNI